MLSLRQKLAKNYINALGWRTKRKLFLIESDDWGSLRMPSYSEYMYYLQHGLQVDKNYFDKFDSIESAVDLEELFSVLQKFKDIKSRPAVISAFFVVANPDFEQIQQSNKEKYFYELITETYKKYPQCVNSFNLIKQGIISELLIPQFHGREHINIPRWMNAINSGSLKEELCFKHMSLLSSNITGEINMYKKNYFSAFDPDQSEDVHLHIEIIKDGLSLFEMLFGFKSQSFMAPTGIWYNYLDVPLQRGGVTLYHGRRAMVHNNGFKFSHKSWGVKNEVGQYSWRRNCTFEPSRNQSYDWVGHCLKEIEIAFRWNKPAVINSHRVNFIGSIFPENRKQSLEKLSILLSKVQNKWPDIEFVSTQELAEIMIQDLNNK